MAGNPGWVSDNQGYDNLDFTVFNIFCAGLT